MKDIYANYLREIKRFPPLKPKESALLFEKAQNGDKEAYKKLIKHNLHLVEHCASPYFKNRNSQDKMDITFAGIEGLMKAIMHFDPEKGAFSTLAALLIHRKIRKELEIIDYDFSFPVNIFDKLLSFEGIKRKKTESLLTDEELKKELKVKDSVFNHLCYYNHLQVLSYEFAKKNKKTKRIPDNEDFTEKVIDSETILPLLYTLKKTLLPFEYYILFSRIIEQKTMREIANEFHISHTYISNIESDTIIHVRNLVASDFLEKKCEVPKTISWDLLKPTQPIQLILYLYLKNQYKDPIELEILKHYLLTTDTSICEEEKDILPKIIKHIEQTLEQEEFLLFKNTVLNEYGAQIFSIDAEQDFEMEKLNDFFVKLNGEHYKKFININHDFLSELTSNEKTKIREYFKHRLNENLSLNSSIEEREYYTWPQLHVIYHLLHALYSSKIEKQLKKEILN